MDMACTSLAFIDGLGAPEMLLIFVIVLVLFGGQKLPEFARGLGKSIREFKKAAAGVEEEFKRALEEDERKHATPTIAPPATVPALAPGADTGGPDNHHYEHHYDEYGNEIPPPSETPVAATNPDGTPVVTDATAPAATETLAVTPTTPVLPDAEKPSADQPALPSPSAATPPPAAPAVPAPAPAPASPPPPSPPAEPGPTPKP